jgi:hypothetical protein
MVHTEAEAARTEPRRLEDHDDRRSTKGSTRSFGAGFSSPEAGAASYVPGGDNIVVDSSKRRVRPAPHEHAGDFLGRHDRGVTTKWDRPC